jgi:hypothetical protein
MNAVTVTANTSQIIANNATSLALIAVGAATPIKGAAPAS